MSNCTNCSKEFALTKFFVGVFVCFLNINVSFAQSDTNCTEKNVKNWSNCWGEAVFDDEKYVGNFQDGQPNGFGSIVGTDGYSYEGEFIKGCFDGFGKYKYANGDIYEGTFKKCKKHGEGLGTLADGSRYEFVYDYDNIKSSKRISDLEQSVTPLVDGRSGAEKAKYNEEAERLRTASVEREKQNVLLAQKLKSTQVEVTYPDGGKYVGQLKDEKPDGIGIYTFANNIGHYYEGEFQGGKFEGKGVLAWSSRGKCEGDFKNNKLEGKATCWFENGDSYQGLFKQGKEDGYGELSYKNGGSYKGQWKGGKENGEGRKIYSDGKVYEGKWKNGNRHGDGVYRFSYSKALRCNWIDDECPKWNKLSTEMSSCYNSCQMKDKACVIRYKSAANAICGMPSVICHKGCDSIGLE